MKSLKKFALVAGAVFAFGVGAQAQHDVKFNFLGFLFNQYQFGYENVLNEEMSAGGYLSYSIWNLETTTFDANGDLVTEEYKLSGLSVIPNFRFYFNPDDDCDGYFAEAYIKWRRRTTTNQQTSVPETNQFGGTEYVTYDYDVSQSATALGVGFGRKWLTNAGFFAETFFGIGKNLIENTKYSEQAVEDYYESIDYSDLNWSGIDIRVAFNVGWRF